jgi:hypothetical protein
MSAQGATLGRGTVRIPILPVAVVVLAATAAVIGLSSIDSIDSIHTISPARTLVTVTDAQRLANSTAAVREQGALIKHRGFAVRPKFFEPTTAIREQGTLSATYGTGWDSIGGQNEALHRRYSPPQDGVAVAPVWGPIMVNGEPCMQCR